MTRVGLGLFVAERLVLLLVTGVGISVAWRRIRRLERYE